MYIFVFRLYGNLAVDFLTECYSENPEKTRLLLMQKIKTYGKSSLLILSDEAKNMEFISHGACKSLCDDNWKKNFSNNRSKKLFLLHSIIFKLT